MGERNKTKLGGLTPAVSVCINCGNPTITTKEFRDLSILCQKRGFYVLESTKQTALFCLCFKSEFIQQRRRIRKRRSRFKRMIALTLKYKPAQWKAKRLLLERSSEKASRRQMNFEDEVLWDVASGWFL